MTFRREPRRYTSPPPLQPSWAQSHSVYQGSPVSTPGLPGLPRRPGACRPSWGRDSGRPSGASLGLSLTLHHRLQHPLVPAFPTLGLSPNTQLLPHKLGRGAPSESSPWGSSACPSPLTALMSPDSRAGKASHPHGLGAGAWEGYQRGPSQPFQTSAEATFRVFRLEV